MFKKVTEAKGQEKTGDLLARSAAAGITFALIASTILLSGCSSSGRTAEKPADIGTQNHVPPAEPVTTVPDAPEMTTEKAVKVSKWIILAESISSEARELPNGNIFTFSEFKVLRSVKGGYGESRLSLRVIGGRVNERSVTKPFRVDFRAGQKYVLFLGSKNSEGYPTVNPQGVYIVSIDSATGSETVSPRPDLPLYDADTGVPRQREPQAVLLKDFLYSMEKIK